MLKENYTSAGGANYYAIISGGVLFLPEGSSDCAKCTVGLLHPVVSQGKVHSGKSQQEEAKAMTKHLKGGQGQNLSVVASSVIKAASEVVTSVEVEAYSCFR